MGTIFNSDFMYGLSKLVDMIILNLIYVLTCLPVFTIGAANVAMYEVALKLEEDTESYVFKSYLEAFKNNFKIGTKVWCIMLMIMSVIFVDLIYAGTNSGMISNVLYIVVLSITTIFGLLSAFIFPVMAKFENQWKIHMKNALLMALAHLPYTILLILINSVGFMIMLVVPRTIIVGIPVYLFIGFSGSAYICSMIYNRIFTKYE